MVLNRTTCNLIGVPAKALMNWVIPERTLVMFVDPIEPEVSTNMPKLPPHRERVAENVGATLMLFVLRFVSRSTPPALSVILS